MLIRIWSLSTSLVVISALLAGVASPAALADDNEESMESIWADESQPTTKTEDKKPQDKMPSEARNLTPAVTATPALPAATTPATTAPVTKPVSNSPVPSMSITSQTNLQPATPPAIFIPASTAKKEEAVQPSTQANVQGDLSESPSVKAAPTTAAPLVKFDEFSSSHFIKQGGWPGIGPFHRQPGVDDAFVDESGNSLNLNLTGGRISQATFNLVNKGTTYDDFLELQVASEFLLEGLNVKTKNIMDFNQQLEDAKDNLLNQSNTSPVTINTGRYIATINKQGLGDGKYSYVLSVVSKDASPDVIKEHSKESKEVAKEQTKEPGRFSFLNKSNKSNPDFIIRQNQDASQTKPTNDLTETFSKTIQSWQDIKKIAVRQRKTDDLKQVLAGKALIRQTDAIKWLSTNHKYYDMNPKGVTIERFSELTPGQKYAVYVEIKEVSKLMDDATSQVIKEQDDSYKVNYTVEKIDGGWYITDSSIVDKSSTPSASRSQGKSR